MFDIGFWEIAVIAVVGLLILGPERMPAAARTLGVWIARVRHYVAHVQADFEKEINASEIKSAMEQAQQSMYDANKSAVDTQHNIQNGINNSLNPTEWDKPAESSSEPAAVDSNKISEESQLSANASSDETDEKSGQNTKPTNSGEKH